MGCNRHARNREARRDALRPHAGTPEISWRAIRRLHGRRGGDSRECGLSGGTGRIGCCRWQTYARGGVLPDLAETTMQERNELTHDTPAKYHHDDHEDRALDHG